MVVSNRYAMSLYEIANEENILKEVSSQMQDMATILLENSDLFSVLSAPNINVADKLAIAEKLFKDKVQPIFYNFVAILVEKSRIDLFFEIKNEFVEIYNKNNNIIKAQVTTAVEIDEALKEQVLGKIKAKTNSDVLLECMVDPSILGGIIIKYDNTLIDSSVKTRLLNLNSNIKEVGV